MKKLSLKNLTFAFTLTAAFGLALPSIANAGPPPPPGGGDAPPPPPGGGDAPPPPPGGGDAPPLPPGQQPSDGGGPPIPAGQATQEQTNAEDVLYANEQYDEAAIIFHAIVSGDKQGDPARAQFWLGKALFNMGFYSGSIAAFDVIVQAGPQHPYHQPTLPWLASLSRKLPEGAGVLEKVGTYKPSDLEREQFDEVRDELYYLLGRFYYQKGDLGQSIALLSQVPESSDFFIPAQYFLGVAETREFHGPEAVNAFKNVLRKNIQMREAKGKKGKKKKKMSERKMKKLGITSVDLDFEEQNQRFEELANIALGYIFYQVGKFETANKYFDRVPMESPYWLDSVFAGAWSEFRMVEKEPDDANRHYQRTLGYIHTLNAPFFYDYLYPEAIILKAVTYYFNCKYGPAKAAIDEFNRRYLKTKDDLQAVLDSAPEDFELYELSVQVREAKSNLDPFVEKVARKSLQDKTLEKNYAYVSRLEFETNELFKQQSSAFQGSGAGDFVSEQLDFALGIAKERTGGLARQRLMGQIKEIKDLEREAIKVEYEIINKLKTVGEGAQGEIQKPSIDKEHEIYNYNGEYWQDELGYYNYKITSVCTE